MVGREVLLRVEKGAARPGETLLAVENLQVFDDRGIEKVRGLSLEVRAGEIVGLAGIDGNGQTELIDAMTGLRRVAAGSGDGRGRGRHHGERVPRLRRGPRPHSRGSPAPRARTRVHDRREHRPARLQTCAGLQVRLALSRQAGRAWRALDQGVRRRGGGPQTRAGGLQGATSRRWCSPARSTATRAC